MQTDLKIVGSGIQQEVGSRGSGWEVEGVGQLRFLPKTLLANGTSQQLSCSVQLSRSLFVIFNQITNISRGP